MSYSKDLREKVLAVVEEGMRQEKARKMFKLGSTTITQWKKLRAETGSLENRPLERSWRKIDAEKLKADVEEKPDDFDWERSERFGCSGQGIESARKKHKITRKKDNKLRGTQWRGTRGIFEKAGRNPRGKASIYR